MSEMCLEQKILEKMIEHLDIEDIDVETFDYTIPIFASEDDEEERELELDSIDAMELVVILYDEFGVKVEVADMEKLQTIQAIADYVRAECENKNE